MKGFSMTDVADFTDALMKVTDEMSSLWAFKGGRIVVENREGQRLAAWWDPDRGDWILGEE